MALIGNTVRLKASFVNWAGDPASPSGVKLKIYGLGRKQVGDDITPTETATGKFQHDFVIPDDPAGHLIYEFSGELEGTPVVGRGKLSKIWE